MKMSEARDILLNEASCVLTASTGKCKRNCDECELVKPSKDILSAYVGVCNLINFYINGLGDDDVLVPSDLDSVLNNLASSPIVFASPPLPVTARNPS